MQNCRRRIKELTSNSLLKMIWLQNLFNFLALNLLRLFAFLPYSLTIYIGYALGWLAAHIPMSAQK